MKKLWVNAQKLWSFLCLLPWAEKSEVVAALGKILVARIFGQPTTVISRGGFQIRAGLSSGQGLWCALAGSWYEPELDFLCKILKPGNTLVDIGANIGIYSLYGARSVGPAGRVFAFEPNPPCFKILQENLQINRIQNAEAVPGAVSSFAGKTILTGEATRWNSLRLGQAKPGSGMLTTEVAVLTLDNFFSAQSLTQLRIIKIDAEGQEDQVLAGARQTLSTYRPILIIEDLGAESKPIYDIRLAALGYEVLPRQKSVLGLPSPNLIYAHRNDPVFG